MNEERNDNGNVVLRNSANIMTSHAASRLLCLVHSAVNLSSRFVFNALNFVLVLWLIT